VRFDDRLRTVLAQPASDPHDRAVRWRQLVELVTRAGEAADPDLLDRALAQIEAEVGFISERVRSAAALAIAPLNPPADLVAIFASDGIAVAAPLLASARLSASEWKHVSAAASEECRTFIAAMRSEQPAGLIAPEPARPASEPSADGEAGHVPSIGEVVARIERLRQAREPDTEPSDQPGQPEEPPRLFRWECNESGQIDWVDGAPRGPLIGRSIAQGDSGVDRQVERAFAVRAPFHEGVMELTGAGAIGGLWKISGVPAFERSSGRFAGYRGIAQRSAGAAPAADAGLVGNPTSLRELVHEIKTPLNAIIGFAEIISGEYFGPAEHKYRERAEDIVAQARLLLGAIDDLDFAAKVRSAAAAESAHVNLGDLVEQLAPLLRELADSRGVDLQASRSVGDLTVAVDLELAERLIRRMGSALIERTMTGERLRLSVDRERDQCLVTMTRPAALCGVSEQELFGAPDDAGGEDLRLRLVRGMARIAGADLVISDDTVALSFPRA
jgi:hypothetical protein